MFAMRGIAVSFSVFFVVYGALSALVCGLWRRIKIWLASRQLSTKRTADLLFGLRVVPFLLATGVTLALAVPSFLLLEPRSVDEPMSPVPVALALCGMAMLLVGAYKAVTSWVRASQAIARWSSNARTQSRALDSTSSITVMQMMGVAPPLAAAGIMRSSVWLSQAAEFVLTEQELQSALRHEIVHVRRRDNLRKLVLRLVVFPGMAKLESDWRAATEMAADDAAVSSASEALDLAAAVIKLSRLAPLALSGDLTTALVNSPAEFLNARVERLIAWTETGQTPPREHWFLYTSCAAAAMVVTLALTYSELLIRVHAATEWLVR
jgi:beta-lactamase regulating signal transducer with metallopeptidase domain